MLPKFCCRHAVHTKSAMVFGPNFKRKKGVHIGRRHKRADTYRRAQEQVTVLAPRDDGAGDPPAIDTNVGEAAGVVR